MSRRLWLVRHGSTEWTGLRWCGRTDLPLSTRGRAEARALARRLSGELPADAEVISSPSRRARETAQFLVRGRRAAERRRPIQVSDLLLEVDFGTVDGMSWADVERQLPDLARRILEGVRVDWPGGEPAEAVDARVRALRELLDSSEGGLVLVSHGALLGQLVRELTASVALGRAMLAPATALALVREGRNWRPAGARP